MTRISTPNTYSYIQVFIEHQTDKALYIHVSDAEGKTSKAWVPKSQVSHTYDLGDGVGYVVLRLADWIIKSKMLKPVPLDEETKVKLDTLTVQGVAGYNDSRMPSHKKESDEDDIPF